MANTIKTTILLAALTGLIIFIGYYFGGQQGMIFAFIIAVVMNFSSYWFSDKIVLSIYRAKPVTREEAPQLYRIVERLTQKAGLPMPRIYLLPHEAPNAFATGRNPKNAAVAVTQGLLRLLSEEELEGVLAHELAHVKNRDILISSIAATLAGAIMLLAYIARWGALLGGYGGSDDREGGIFGLLFMAILAPIAAMLIQLAISRSREYQADATGAKFAGNPYGLANALQKLDYAAKRIPMNASNNTQHMLIVKPLSGHSLASLFSTHPPIKERIRRLTGHDLY
jgi:heat shock protein HtpX